MVAIAIVATLVVAGVLYTVRRLSSHGHIITLGVDVYRYQNLSDPVEFIDWEYLAPGDIKQVTCYAYNPGNVPINITIYARNWLPPAAGNYLNLSGTVDTSPLQPGNFTRLQIQLAVSENTTGITDFSFDIMVEGSYEPPV